jgi:hypothetical protein
MCYCCKEVIHLETVIACALVSTCPKRVTIVKWVEGICVTCHFAHHNRLTPCVVRRTPVIVTFQYESGLSMEQLVKDYYASK